MVFSFESIWKWAKAQRGNRKKSKSSKEVTVILIGLDNAGKTTIKNDLAGDLDKEVTPTIGFAQLPPVERFGVSLRVFDVGGSANFRGIWDSFFPDIYGSVFVVDSADSNRLAESATELKKASESLFLQGKPMLILANKQDLGGALDEAGIIEKLRLNDIKGCKYSVALCIANAACNQGDMDDRILGGLEWLMASIVSDYEALSTRVKEDQEKKKEANKKQMAEVAERVKKAKEARELAKKLAEKSGASDKTLSAESGGMQICLECNSAPATSKCVASSWRPVCDKCKSILKAAYEKKSSIPCSLPGCERSAVKKSSKYGWKPVCQHCHALLVKGISPVEIEARLKGNDEHKKDFDEKISNDDAQNETKLKAKEATNRKTLSLQQAGLLGGKWICGDGSAETIVMRQGGIGLYYDIFHCDHNESWGEFALVSTPGLYTGDPERFSIVLRTVDGEQFEGEYRDLEAKKDTQMNEEGLLEGNIHWSDGDTWTRPSKLDLVIFDVVGFWSTPDGSHEHICNSEVKIESQKKTALDVSNNKTPMKSFTVVHSVSNLYWADLIINLPQVGRSTKTKVLLKDKDGGENNGYLSVSSVDRKYVPQSDDPSPTIIEWDDGDRWIFVGTQLPH